MELMGISEDCKALWNLRECKRPCLYKILSHCEKQQNGSKGRIFIGITE